MFISLRSCLVWDVGYCGLGGGYSKRRFILLSESRDILVSRLPATGLSFCPRKLDGPADPLEVGEYGFSHEKSRDVGPPISEGP